MKFKLDERKLQPGDIILAGYNDADSREIQRRTNSLYSHAMLYWYSSIIHSTEIVITENPSRMLYEDGENVCVLRLKAELRQDARIKILIDYARSFVGTLYDKVALDAMAEDAEFKPNKNRQMCAKFVAQCFNHVLIDLVDDYERCSPQDLINLRVIDIINDVLIEATPIDEEFANTPDVTSDQYRAIFSIINRLRKKFPDADIMSLQQLESFLESNPEQDEVIVDIMSKTDYFKLWEIEREKCPYLYNIDSYKNFPYCKDKIRHAIQIIEDSKRITQERNSLKEYYSEQIEKVGQLNYYCKMIELQDNIIGTANERIEVANSFLKENNIVKIGFPWCVGNR